MKKKFFIFLFYLFLIFIINNIYLISCFNFNNKTKINNNNNFKVNLNILNYNDWKYKNNFFLSKKNFFNNNLDFNEKKNFLENNYINNFKDIIKKSIQDFYSSNFWWEQIDIETDPKEIPYYIYNFYLNNYQKKELYFYKLNEKISIKFKAKKNSLFYTGECNWEKIDFLIPLEKWFLYENNKINFFKKDFNNDKIKDIKKIVIKKFFGIDFEESIFEFLKLKIIIDDKEITIEAEKNDSFLFKNKIILNYL